MRRRNISFAATLLVLAVTSSDLHALANRVFVSARLGNDANACASVTTPCQTFAGAVLQLNPDGEVIVLDSGGYGPVTITQGLTIEAPAGVTAFVHPPSGDGITINAGGSDTVVLRGLVLNGGSGNGIKVNTVGTLQIEGCVINGFNGDGVNFVGAGALFVKDTIARGNGGSGIHLFPASGSARASISHCRMEKNVISGLYAQSSVSANPFAAQASVVDSVASGNGGWGFYATDGEINIESCLVANNPGIGIGIGFGAGIIRVSNSTITDNGTGIVLDSGTIYSRLNNTLEGNGTNGAFTSSYSAK